MKMEYLLCSTNLWHFIKKGLVYPRDKRKSGITFFLVLSAVDDCVLSIIFHKFDRVDNTKEVWDALEIEYSERGRKTTNEVFHTFVNPTIDIIDDVNLVNPET